jgi:trigger factor
VPETCKRTIDITVPAAEVERETELVVNSLKEKARIPGFRPGKAPAGMIRARFAAEIREEVLRSLLPKHFEKAAICTRASR